MPRPCKRRRICAMPACGRFGPIDNAEDRNQTVTMTLDEFESIRLIDLEGMTQEQCAVQMSVARTTAQAIYASARRKLAECLVNRKELNIAGGDYWVCDGSGEGSCCEVECGRRLKDSLNKRNSSDRNNEKGRNN